MSEDATFTLLLENELREQFIHEAELTRRPASELVREFMKSFIARQRGLREHDLRFRSAVEGALVQADDPLTQRTPHDKLAASWQTERAELEKRLTEQDG